MYVLSVFLGPHISVEKKADRSLLYCSLKKKVGLGMLEVGE